MLTTKQVSETFVSVKDIVVELTERVEELEKKCGIGEVTPKED